MARTHIEWDVGDFFETRLGFGVVIGKESSVVIFWDSEKAMYRPKSCFIPSNARPIKKDAVTNSGIRLALEAVRASVTNPNDTRN